MSIYDYRDRPAYSSDFRPYTNRNISKWWGKPHDALLLELIEKWQWHWYWEVADAVVSITPKEAIAPFLSTHAWSNKIMYYAITRAQELGLPTYIRKPTWKVCPLCNESFREDSLPHPLTKRLGVEHLDFCAPCLRDTVLQNTGNNNATKEQILRYLKELTEVLQSIPRQGFGEGIDDFRGLDYDDRLAVLRVLQTKPTVKRVKEVFGSWLPALIDAGVLENDVHRTSLGIQCIAKDGHVCLSLGEKTIDDYLFLHNISHAKEPPYPEGRYRADFLVNGIFIEYFGLEGNPEYDTKTKLKQKMCEKYGIRLISIYPSDLVNVKKLKKKLQQEGVA